MGGAKRYPSIASYGDDGFRRLNPSYVLNLHWSFAALFMRKTDGVDNETGSSDLPVGRFVDGVSSYFSDFPKNISVPMHPKSHLELSHPTPQEGRIMIVTDAGWNAVDAAAFCARRDCRAGWRKACERSTACGREMLQRTAKSCGPDAPTLASSLAEVQPPNRVGMRRTSVRRRWQKSPITGESTKETVKTIACGNAG